MGLNSPIQLNRLVGRIPRKGRIILHKDNQDPTLNIRLNNLAIHLQDIHNNHRCSQCSSRLRRSQANLPSGAARSSLL